MQITSQWAVRQSGSTFIIMTRCRIFSVSYNRSGDRCTISNAIFINLCTSRQSYFCQRKSPMKSKSSFLTAVEQKWEQRVKELGRHLSQEGKMLTRGSGETGGISLIIKDSVVSVFVRRRLLYIPYFLCVSLLQNICKSQRVLSLRSCGETVNIPLSWGPLSWCHERHRRPNGMHQWTHSPRRAVGG